MATTRTKTQVRKGLGRDLKRFLPSHSVLTDAEDLFSYRSDATADLAQGNPEAVVLCESTGDVSSVMGYAFQHGIPVTPRGAGSGLSGGCTPLHGGIVLDMKRLNHILEINRGNMTASAEAGVVLARFKKELAGQNLFYPPDPQSAEVCTLGGNVATRAGGPRGVKYGTTGNYILGLELVLPDGDIVQTGGTCVKQSVGYDLTHLLCGSEGTLGVITRVHLRILPLPPVNRTAVVTCDSPEQAAALVSDIIAAGTVPAMMEFLTVMAVMLINTFVSPPLPMDGAAYLLLDIDGTEAQVSQDIRTLTSLCLEKKAKDVRVVSDPKETAAYWRGRASLYPLALTMARKLITEDVTVPRDRLPAFVKRVGEISAALGMIIGIAGHAGDGNMHPSMLLPDVTEASLQKAQKAIAGVIRAGLNLGGTISGEHGIGLHKAEFIEWELGKNQIALMKRIKAAFDPKNIMNPGKIWPEGASKP
ncbi:MAG: FAD-linked oxidase C-terminal domain-containing protein [Thermodesulfobacteriota bacterium]